MALLISVPQPYAISGPHLISGSSLNTNFANPAVSSGYNLTATGAALASALLLTTALCQFSTVAANTGAALAAMKPGQSQVIFNDGASPLTVYALNANYTIDGAASVPLANGKRCVYFCVSPGIIISAQLGVVSA